jgi:hypothetical protein
MVPLLTRHKNAKFLEIVVDFLHLLSRGHQESKILLLEFGGPSSLIEILRSSNYPKLLLMTMRLMKILSVCSQNKKALINCGKRVNERERVFHLNFTLYFYMQCKSYHLQGAQIQMNYKSKILILNYLLK